MGSHGEDDDFLGFSQPTAGRNKSGAFHHGPGFDVRELERKLKALGSEEDRRTYYARPMLSEALIPTPLHDVVRGASHSPNMKGNYNTIHPYEGIDVAARRLALNVVYEECKAFDDGGGMEGLYRSYSMETNSARNSASSSLSDTGYEKETNSVWERDSFPITSDLVGALKNTIDDGAKPNHRTFKGPSKQLKNPRDGISSAQSSPLLYSTDGYATHPLPTIRGNNPSAEFYDESSVHVQYKGARRGLLLKSPNREHVTLPRDLHSKDGYVGYGDMMDLADNEITSDYWEAYMENEQRFPSIASPSSSIGSRHDHSHIVMDFSERKNQHQAGAGKKSPAVNHQESYDQLPLGHYKYREPKKSFVRWKAASVHGDQFSYTGCKERLLSGRSSFEQCSDIAGPLSDGEIGMTTMSHYTRLKLKQNNNHRSDGVKGPPGTPNQEYGINGLTQGLPEHYIRGPSQRSPLITHRSSPLLNQSRASPLTRKGYNGDSSPVLYVQGPSWSKKATLSAVREKMRDPSFRRFVTNAPANSPQSRVFDSFAMVKCSYDPKQDFKESMVDMIMEKDLSSSYDMLELLQCYLTLNPPRCHDTIVSVFTDVWAEFCKDM